MTAPVLEPLPSTVRVATRRHYVVCSPTHFDVVHVLNPWMDPTVPVDRDRALAQWRTLVDTYRDLGHRVTEVTPEPGLPDMVFAANAALIVDGRAVGARFATAERAPEAAPYRRALARLGLGDVAPTVHVNEGEGDLLVVGDTILAGTGFRTDVRAHAEIAARTDREVVTLRLVDARTYHLDTAVAVLSDTEIAYLPDAFDGPSRAELARRYPDAVLGTAADAAVLGLNAVSDGRHVVLPHEATDLADRLAARGFAPVPLDLSELRKAGGGPKCCTLEVRLQHGATELRPEHGATELRPERMEPAR